MSQGLIILLPGDSRPMLCRTVFFMLQEPPPELITPETADRMLLPSLLLRNNGRDGKNKKGHSICRDPLICMVGATGIEPVAPAV